MAGDMTNTQSIDQPYEGRRTRSVQHLEWSPAQIIGIAAGLFLTVLGGVALARSGADFSNIPLTRSTAAGLPFTCLSATVTLVVGVLILGGSIYPAAAKGVMGFFGVITLAFGLIVAIDPTPFTNMWGYNQSSGVMMAIVGGVLLLAGALSPIFTNRRSVDRVSGVDGDVRTRDTTRSMTTT
jgi:hypothetical protein